MSEMLERVAKAIYESMGKVMGPEAPDDWHDIGPEHERARDEWRTVATAAIEAMPAPRIDGPWFDGQKQGTGKQEQKKA